jgi:hypothetical protein
MPLRARFRSIGLLLLLAVAPAARAQNAPDAGEAASAVNDLLRHFWVGDAQTGHALDTWGGRARSGGDMGVLWERSILLLTLMDRYEATHDPDLAKRIAADWRYVRRRLTPAQRRAVGPGTASVSQDDVGWACLMYLNAFRVTGDRAALDDARGLFAAAWARWTDERLGGGMWYDDSRTYKSSYQAAVILAGLRLYDLTGERIFRDRAMALYGFMERALLRPDGLYWCEMWQGGPQAVGGIHEALSVTFLGGNMAMGVVHARLYRATGEEIYRRRALRTAEAIRLHETDGQGNFLDDRDAWANGTFMGAWAAEVLTLPGMGKESEVLWKTARTVWERARTPEGFFSGCWAGPVGEDCPWSKAGFAPDQLMVSASAANVLVGAASLSVRKPWPVRIEKAKGPGAVTNHGAGPR